MKSERSASDFVARENWRLKSALAILAIVALALLVVRTHLASVIYSENWQGNWAANWTVLSGSVASDSSGLYNANPPEALLKYNGAVPADHSVQMTANCTGANPMRTFKARVRYDAATGNSYYAWFSVAEIILYAKTPAGFYQLGSYSDAGGCGVPVKLKARGTSLTVLRNGLVVITASDTALTSGERRHLAARLWRVCQRGAN